MARRDAGFSVIEMLIALSITLSVSGAVFALLNPAVGSFAAEPEASDMQQRLRVGQDALYKDLVAAGAGPFIGAGRAMVGPLLFAFAPVLPFRPGTAEPGSYSSDTVTVTSVRSGAAHTSLAADAPAAGAVLEATGESGCPVGKRLCGFAAGASALIFDDLGNFEIHAVAFVDDEAARIVIKPALKTTYQSGSRVVEAAQHTYYLKTDARSSLFQLMMADGATTSDAPVVDHVVGLAFEYYGEPQPPLLTRPLSDISGPWTTYGPKPPPLGTVAGTAYPPGENCVFVAQDGAAMQQPRLAVLDSGGNPGALVRLAADQLTDGPWCPDPGDANRWDADLLRIRKISVTLRIEAAADALRGPASVLFSRGGTSRGSHRWLPDREIRFQVTPRNLNLER